MQFLMRNDTGKPMRKVDTVFLNHGDDNRREALSRRIQIAPEISANQREIATVKLPREDSGWFNLTDGDWCESPINDPLVVSDLPSAAESEKLDVIIELLTEQNNLLKQLVESQPREFPKNDET